MTEKDICKVHYLSCVEAYFGAWIKEYIPLAALYCGSYLTWREILESFTRPEIGYANFSAIKRIQDLAEEAGIIIHLKQNGFPDKRNEIDLMLLSVNESFFGLRRAWRKDHYIAVEALSESKISYLNEYPLERKEIPIQTFKEQYGGNYLIYSFVSDNLSGLADCEHAQWKKICEPKEREICYPSSTIRLRDAIGILRVSRRRTLEWLKYYAAIRNIFGIERICERFTEQINFADRSYFELAKILARRGNAEQAALNKIVDELNFLE